jgi:multiple sugar transport system substrate-binding protein
VNAWFKVRTTKPHDQLAFDGEVRAAVLTRRDCLAWATAAATGLARATPEPVQRLTVAAFPAVDDILRAAVPRWRQLHPGVDVVVISRQLNDHHVAMTTALSAASGLPDLMAVEVGYIGRFAQGRGLVDLRAQPFGADRLRDRYVPYTLTQATNTRGELVGVPSDIGPGTLLYRHDLLHKSGLEESALTQSWKSFVAAGAKIKAATGAYLLSHARDIKDIVIRTGLQPGEGIYYGAGNQVLVTGERFTLAFELARQVRRENLDARVIAWTADWSEGFRRGSIATQMMGAWLAGHLNNWLAPATKGLWRAAQLPERAFSTFGGTFLCLPRASAPARSALAWEFMQLVTLNRELQLAAFKQHDAFPAAVEALDDPFFDEPLPFLGGQRARRVWREAARHTQAPAVHRQDAFAREVIDGALDRVLLRGQDIASALGDAARLLEARAHR